MPLLARHVDRPAARVRVRVRVRAHGGREALDEGAERSQPAEQVVLWGWANARRMDPGTQPCRGATLSRTAAATQGLIRAACWRREGEFGGASVWVSVSEAR